MLSKIIAEKVHREYGDSWNYVGVHEVSPKVLDEMISVCDSKKHMEERMEWYDDESNPEWNTWIDVEGEGYGWLWSKRSEDQWHGILKENMLDFIEGKKRDLCNIEEYVVIASNGVTTIYHFIEREEKKRDMIYSFSDEEILL